MARRRNYAVIARALHAANQRGDCNIATMAEHTLILAGRCLVCGNPLSSGAVGHGCAQRPDLDLLLTFQPATQENTHASNVR